MCGYVASSFAVLTRPVEFGRTLSGHGFLEPVQINQSNRNFYVAKIAGVITKSTAAESIYMNS